MNKIQALELNVDFGENPMMGEYILYSVLSEKEAIDLVEEQPQLDLSSSSDRIEVISLYQDCYYIRFYGNHPNGCDILPDRDVWEDEKLFRSDYQNAINPYCNGFAICKVPFGTVLDFKRQYFPDDFRVVKWV